MLLGVAWLLNRLPLLTQYKRVLCFFINPLQNPGQDGSRPQQVTALSPVFGANIASPLPRMVRTTLPLQLVSMLPDVICHI
jgi:hypothetical protein